MQRHLPVQRRGEAGAVRHHQEAASRARHQIARQPQHFIRRVLVEIAGRLVREQQQRFRRQRAADRDALLLAPDTFRIAPEQVFQAKMLDQLVMPAASWRPAMRDWNTRLSATVRLGSG